MDERTNGWVDGCTDGPMGVGQMDEQTEDEQMTNRWTDGWKEGQMEEWIELTNGWMDGRIDLANLPNSTRSVNAP